MLDIWKEIDTLLTTPPPIKTERMPTFYPSAASCLSLEDNSPIGGCNRAQYFRCKGYSKTDPPGLFSQYIFAAGNMWEDWITEQLKKAGLWSGNSIKYQEISKNVSGEIDVMVSDPSTGEQFIIEVKTYSSSNYIARKALAGAKAWNGREEVEPRPKDQNLLQSFLYLGKFADQGIKNTLLIYFDRACGGPDNNFQFVISVHEENGLRYPKVECKNAYGKLISYVDRRITLEAIYERYESLRSNIIKDVIPVCDYDHVYSDKTMKKKIGLGLIGKTKLEKWERNKEKYPVGDWQCFYCDYSQLCQGFKDEGK